MVLIGIYKIQSKVKPERIYIGSSSNIRRRKVIHFTELKKNKHHSIKLQNHYNKYGREDLIFDIIEETSIDYLLKVEQKYIDKINPYFNILKVAGSNLGKIVSESTREKLRQINKGKKHSEETRKKISDSGKGRRKKPMKLSEETKRKISESLRGRKLSKDTREKQRIAHLGKKSTLGKRWSKDTRKKQSDSIKKWWEERRNKVA
jgi:group I intron endonuclease